MENIEEKIKQLQEKVAVYREDSALNFSLLATLFNNPKEVKMQKDPSAHYFVFGTLVEELITDVDVSDKYVLATIPEPTGQMSIYVNALHRYKGDHDLAYKAVEEANNGVKVRSTATTFKTNYNTQGKAYYEFLQLAENKIVLSLEDWNSANNISKNVKNLDLFRKIQGNTNYKVFYNVPLFTTYKLKTEENIEVKALLDMIVFNESDRTIEIYDFKTTSSPLTSFIQTVKKYRYDIQASLYSYITEKIFSDWHITAFKFIVGNKNNQQVKIFTTSVTDKYNSRFGFKTPSGYLYKGWVQLIEEYLQHERYDYWDLPVEFWEEEIMLKIFEE